MNTTVTWSVQMEPVQIRDNFHTKTVYHLHYHYKTINMPLAVQFFLNFFAQFSVYVQNMIPLFKSLPSTKKSFAVYALKSMILKLSKWLSYCFFNFRLENLPSSNSTDDKYRVPHSSYTLVFCIDPFRTLLLYFSTLKFPIFSHCMLLRRIKITKIKAACQEK